VLDLARQRRYFHSRMNFSPAFAWPSTPNVSAVSRALPVYFDTLFAAYGPQGWWPGRSRFETIAGAILTQNTAWANVELALRNLRSAKLLSAAAIREVEQPALEKLLRPAGYFRQKARTLKGFAEFLHHDFAGSLAKMFRTPSEELRPRLLALRGIGPETADCILLYAGKQPVFVVDAYTRRMLERHGLAAVGTDYEEIRRLFQSSLPHDPQLFNEFHALIVHIGKAFCRKREPRCAECPLREFLPATPGARVRHGEAVCA